MAAQKITEADVLRALGTVQDPDLHRDLVSLGMIEKLSVDNDAVSFTVVLTTPACPLKGKIESDCRRAVSAIPGVKQINVAMDARVPAGRGQHGKQGVPNVSNIIAVASGKGGVGKTTVAVNVALALSETGARVGVLDADVTGPNVPIMLGVSGEPHAVNGKIEPLTAYGVKVISISFFVPEGTPVIWRGPMVGGAIQQFLNDVSWGQLDYLVVDLPPGTGDASISLAQLIPLSGVVIVSTPQDVALLDATKSLAMFQKLEAPIVGLVENMSYFVCPHCNERVDIFGHGGAEHAAERLNLPFLGRVPLTPEIRVGGDQGVPVLRSNPESVEADAFRQIAAQIAARISVLSLGPGGKRPTWVPLPMAQS
ncbi:MAG TPA: Mrp/NBP35 family ATP-binding protein [Chloroflexota bacterium]|nr:Mrp/NBP35 family ATP-binding protein [Chloroflexota bacterium]HUX87354.1 Mrp/NBP35 family ATP-binding protein [Chloroflexota bacterium]HVB97346.1 Mrp/NBP35 family ATP-binding protein [Chloroflexota bacterium]